MKEEGSVWMNSRSLPAQDFLKIHFRELPCFTRGMNETVNGVAREWLQRNTGRQVDATGPVCDRWNEKNGRTVWMPLAREETPCPN